MNNLFSKSPETYEKLIHLTTMILNEQRHQRGDMATMKRQLHVLISDMAIQKQVDDYYDKDNTKDIPDENN